LISTTDSITGEQMKIDHLLNAIRIGSAVAKSLFTGRLAKGLEKTEEAAVIAQAVKKMIKPKKK
jgi:hypothetical protein